jgi:uncharacterized UPF0146 family protein
VARARKVVEVGAGASFATALALQSRAPQAAFLLTDVDPRVLQAPPPLKGVVHDVTKDNAKPFGGADLVYAVRLPEELQAPVARLARQLGADLALRPLKDEWADLAPHFLRHEAWPEGWRFFPRA